MPLISMNVPESFTNSALSLLNRIAVALERLAGPVTEYHPPELAGLRDYSHIPPDEVARIKEAQEDFARNEMLIPGSPAYLQRIADYEAQVADAYGSDAVDKLPWRVRRDDIPEQL